MPRVEPSRITPPSLPRIVDRPRLLGSLRENEGHRIILILGQAAQGKSTLAASFAQSSELNSVWINISPADEDPVGLYYATASALAPFLSSGRAGYVLSYPASRMGPREPEALYRDWASTLFDQVEASIRITFDGLDRLPEGAPSLHFLQLMLNAAPRNVRFMLLSRKEPPFPLHEWRVKRRAFVLTNDDLAFTCREVRSFLRRHCGLSCDWEQVRKVWRFTEGWVGGLVLLSQALRTSESPDAEPGAIDVLPERFRAEVFIYFEREIFDRLSESDARVLLLGSVFEEVSPSLVDAITGSGGSVEVLQRLAARNLFVHAVHDAARGWVYRCHQLFREFLQTMWRRHFPRTERRRLLLRAARACARRRDPQTAVDFFLQAEAYRSAASVLRVLGREMLQTGRERNLAGILDRFPERIIQAKPWLLTYRAVCRRYSHAAENVVDLRKAESMFRVSGDVRGHLMTLASLMEAVMLQGRDRVPIHRLLSNAEELLAALDFSRHPREQALLWLQMGFCYALRSEDTRQGYRASQNAFHLAGRIKDRPLQIQALIHSVIPCTFLGEYREGDRIRSQAEAMLRKRNYPELEAIFLKMWSELVLFAGRLDLELARSLIERLNDRIDRYGLLYIKPPAMYSEFAYHMYAGDTEQAEEIGRRLQDMSEAIDNPYGRGFCLILLGLLAYRQSRWTRAGELLESGLEIFRHPSMRSPLHDHEFSIGAGLVRMHLGDWQEAEGLLLRSLRYFTGISSQLARTEALLSLALLDEKRGRRKPALEHLEPGLSIASSREFTHFVIISPQDQIDVCVLALKAGTQAARDYAEHLLQTGLRETVASMEPRLRKNAAPSVRKVMDRVMLHRHRGQRPRVSIQTLGRFRVLVDGEALPDEAWAGNQAKTMLKALLVLAAQKPVRKELLIEELWPDSDPGAGEKTLKSALHRLRHSLEPDMSSRFGSSYVHLKSGFLSLDDELCETDVQLFSRLCSLTRELLRSGEPKKALETFEEAASLYEGDFLPDEPDPQWAREMREHLRKRFIALLFEAARACESSGAWSKAVKHYRRALDCDPLLEEAYRRIMLLYADRGKRSKALKIYEECCRNLKAALDVEPDDLTVSVYRRIRG
jgi:ATP/maltotriose-dependent transcriptional regulator MalT